MNGSWDCSFKSIVESKAKVIGTWDDNFIQKFTRVFIISEKIGWSLWRTFSIGKWEWVYSSFQRRLVGYSGERFGCLVWLWSSLNLLSLFSSFFLDKTTSRKTLISWNWATLAQNIFYIKMTGKNVRIFSFFFYFVKKTTHWEKHTLSEVARSAVLSLK